MSHDYGERSCVAVSAQGPPTDADYANQLRGAIAAVNTALLALRDRGYSVDMEYGYSDEATKTLSLSGSITKTETFTL